MTTRRCCTTSRFTCQPGQVDRPARLDRLGQDHPGQPAAALLRLHQRQHAAGWRRAEALPAQVPAPARSASWNRNRSCSRAPSAKTSPTVLGARCAAGGGRSGCPGSRHPRCHPDLPRRLRHPGRRKRRDPLRRAEAARGDRPHPAQEPAHPDPGRLRPPRWIPRPKPRSARRWRT